MSGRERRDELLAKARQRYAARIASLEERIRRAEMATDRERAQAEQQRLQTAISVGATLLGALAGRRSYARSSLGRAATAARGAGRMMKEGQDIARAEENVAALRKQLEELEAQATFDVDMIRGSADPLKEMLETVEVKPRKSDISVRVFGLGWVPGCVTTGEARAGRSSIDGREAPMNPWHDIADARVTPERFLAIIEIPKGSKKKYEMDKETGLIRLDRILFTSTHYPMNYGFIPRTLAGDGDPLDVLVLCTETLDPLTMVECLPIGVIRMIDNEQVDEKIIAVPFKDPTYCDLRDISELPRHVVSEVSHFFDVYKALEHSQTSVTESAGRSDAMQIISVSLDRYRATWGKGATAPPIGDEVRGSAGLARPGGGHPAAPHVPPRTPRHRRSRYRGAPVRRLPRRCGAVALAGAPRRSDRLRRLALRFVLDVRGQPAAGEPRAPGRGRQPAARGESYRRRSRPTRSTSARSSPGSSACWIVPRGASPRPQRESGASPSSGTPRRKHRGSTSTPCSWP